MNTPSRPQKSVELKSIKIESFKRIKEIEFDLARVNVFVGANGSGKSSILQAVHLASCCIRQVAEVRPETPRTVGINELDYLPTDNYWRLGHLGDWGNQVNSKGTIVKFFFEEQGGNNVISSCELRQARNAGISIRGSVPQLIQPLMRRQDQYFTAYIPGISGIANSENKQSKKVVHRAASYGDSNIYMRNILLLLEQNKESIKRIEEHLSDIIGDITISVFHNENQDLIINCNITTNHIDRPLELAGTGFLQLIQIFSYLYLFKPTLLLIDEPDVHLHPPIQEKLISVLEAVASELGTRIIIATHSPFIVRGRTFDTNVYWLKDGELQESDPQNVETALGWGSLGKKILLISEDQDLTLLRAILRQWPDLDRQIALYPRNGIKSLPQPKEVGNIYDFLGKKLKILIHRDRDTLTDKECAKIQNQYDAEFTSFWFPEMWDIESYLCTPKTLSEVKNISEVQAGDEIKDIIGQHQIDFEREFESGRTTVNRELYASGGSPQTTDLRKDFIENSRVKGKTLLKKIVDRNQSAISRHSLTKAALDGNLAMDLKAKIESIIGDES